MIKKLLLITLATLININAYASGDFPTANPVPGGVAIINLPNAFTSSSKVYYKKKRVLTRNIKNSWQALVGLPLKVKPGIHKIKVILEQGKKKHIEFSVQNKDYETRHITIKNKRMVSPTKKDI